MMSLMSKAYLICICLLLGSCGGSGLDGEYEGRIGSKSEVNILFLNSHEAELRGYWGETLRGTYEKSSIRGKTVDSLVFLGPRKRNLSNLESVTKWKTTFGNSFDPLESFWTGKIC